MVFCKGSLSKNIHTMKHFPLYLLVILPFFSLFCQSEEETLLYEDGDTVKYERISFFPNGHPAQVVYITEGRGRKFLAKSDLFMMDGEERKRKYFQKLDSCFVYYYDEAWGLVGKKAGESIRILEEGFLIGEKNLVAEGHVGDLARKTVELTNTTTQTKVIRVESPDKLLAEPQGVRLLARGEESVGLGFELGRGVNGGIIQISDQNGEKQWVRVETIGYDLLDSDFSATKEAPPLRIGGGEAYVQGASDEKMLKIHHGSKVSMFPLSKRLNIISRPELSGERCLFELVDLGTGGSRYCQVVWEE